MSESADTFVSDLDHLQAAEHASNGRRIYAPEHSAFSAMQMIELIWRERRFVVRCSSLIVLVCAIVAIVLPNNYTATTRLMPADYGGGSGAGLALSALSDLDGAGNGGGITNVASRLLGMNTSGDLLIGVIKSETVEDRVIKRLNLMQVYSDKFIEDGREHLESHTSLSTDAKTGIITISVTDKNPGRAAQIANAYVTELNQALAEVNTSSAHRERLFLEQRLQEVNHQSEADAREFALFSSQNGAVDIPDQAKSMVAAGAELQSQLIVAQSELKGLEQIYSGNNARVKAARARVDELQSQVNKFGGKNVNPSTDTSLGEDQLYPSVRQLPLLGVKYLDLYRRSKVNDAVFELLTKEYEIAKLQEAREIPTAQVLDVALIPGKKSSPHRGLILLAGLFTGFVFSCSYLIGDMLWHRTEETNPKRLLARDIVVSVLNRVDRIPAMKSCRTKGHHIMSKLLG